MKNKRRNKTNRRNTNKKNNKTTKGGKLRHNRRSVKVNSAIVKSKIGPNPKIYFNIEKGPKLYSLIDFGGILDLVKESTNDVDEVISHNIYGIPGPPYQTESYDFLFNDKYSEGDEEELVPIKCKVKKSPTVVSEKLGQGIEQQRVANALNETPKPSPQSTALDQSPPLDQSPQQPPN
jgi:hypothetical protein